MQSSTRKLRLILILTSLAMASAIFQCLPAFAANVNLAWDPKTDSGLGGYKVYYGTSSRSYGTSINVGNVTTYTVTGLNSGTYYFAVTAYYTSGSETGHSNEVSTTVTNATPDSTPPTISLTSPSNGSSSSGTVTISANASDNVGVAGVQFRVDGVNLGSEDTSSPYSVSWNTATVSNGSHTLTARARDAAGNQTTSSSVTVNVSNTPTTTPSSITSGMISSVISVDGNLSESVWNQASSVQFSNAALSDNQVTVKTLWDSTNLYLAYIVQDTSREATNTALWEDDGVEVYVDVANDKSSTMDANDYSVVININNLSSASGISGRTSINSGGYVMEISIPWSYLQTTPSIGKTMGLLLANNDRDNGVSKQFDWLNVIATGNYARPNLWGNLILGASAPADNPLPAPTNVSVK